MQNFPTSLDQNTKLALVGLGYVGLPVAMAFAKHFEVVGYDIDPRKVQMLNKGVSYIDGVSDLELQNASLRFTDQTEDLAQAQVYIVTVPTPIDSFKAPDLSALRDASTKVGKALQEGDVVIYESTVYPGCTEEVCVPILEELSGLSLNQDFSVAYSPERINVGDQVNTFEQIVKITSASNPEAARYVDELYKKVVKAGTYLAPSIKVAEAAKAIENAQRDLNISFVNELALIFERIGIDTQEVLAAAATKWNFLNFKPGLVGGHCIGVDPYYLVHKAESLGYHPQVILSGRRINDNMGKFVAAKVVKLMAKHHLPIGGARVLLLGVAFKENCGDTRNSRVLDTYDEFLDYGCAVEAYDPHVMAARAQDLNIRLQEPKGHYDAIVFAVAHDAFLEQDWRDYLKPKGVLFDVKSALPKEQVTARL